MVVFDYVILEPSLEVDEYPFDPSYTADGDRRCWKTSDLNPSADHYMVRFYEGDSGPLSLFRRAPPLVRWTVEHKGQNHDDTEVVSEADYWRHVRYTGTLELFDISADNRHYYLQAEFESGILTDIWLEESEGRTASSVAGERNNAMTRPEDD